MNLTVEKIDSKKILSPIKEKYLELLNKIMEFDKEFQTAQRKKVITTLRWTTPLLLFAWGVAGFLWFFTSDEVINEFVKVVITILCIIFSAFYLDDFVICSKAFHPKLKDIFEEYEMKLNICEQIKEENDVSQLFNLLELALYDVPKTRFGQALYDFCHEVDVLKQYLKVTSLDILSATYNSGYLKIASADETGLVSFFTIKCNQRFNCKLEKGDMVLTYTPSQITLTCPYKEEKL